MARRFTNTSRLTSFVEITPATLRDVTYIAANMRAQDRREITALLGDSASMTKAADGMLQASEGHAFVASLGGQPIAAIGVVKLLNHLGSAWAFGTDKTRRVIPALTRWGVSEWKPRMIADGYRRIEVRTIVDHDLSRRWLEALGFECEGICRGYGLSGEDFAQYAYVRTEPHVCKQP